MFFIYEMRYKIAFLLSGTILFGLILYQKIVEQKEKLKLISTSFALDYNYRDDIN